MPLYQNTTVNSTSLVIGNYMIFGGSAASTLSGATSISEISSIMTNLGAGIVNSFGHNVEKYDVQAGNAPDPIEGVAGETFTISGELIEYNATALSFVMGGMVGTTASTGSDYSIIGGGGAGVITPKQFALVNRRMAIPVAGSAVTSVLTIIYVWKGTFVNGPQFTAKSDNDTDPINTMSFEIQGEIDGSRPSGQQLYTIKKWL